MATHDDGINDEVPQDMVLEYDAPDLIPPEVHSTEALMDLKELRDVGRHRKIALKGNHWQHKASMKDPMVFWDCALWEGRRDRGGEFRYIRPHMTMHVKGGWQVRIDDNGHYLEDETDWIAEVERKPLRTEVAMTDLLKSAKQRKTRKKDDGFEVVSGGAQSVMVLDDQPVREVEVDEPWEYLEFEDEGGGEPASQFASYAKIAANVT